MQGGPLLARHGVGTKVSGSAEGATGQRNRLSWKQAILGTQQHGHSSGQSGVCDERAARRGYFIFSCPRSIAHNPVRLTPLAGDRDNLSIFLKFKPG